MLKDTEALLEGHFVLSSGLHSPVYVQTALALQYPEIASSIAEKLASQLKKNINSEIDTVVSPAIGGIIIGQEVAKALGVRHIFFEKHEGQFCLRRNFRVNENEKVVVVEDVITTGGSSRKIADLLKSMKADILAFSSIVERTSPSRVISKVVSLVRVDAPTYPPEKCPLCLSGSKPVKMGSSWV